MNELMMSEKARMSICKSWYEELQSQNADLVVQLANAESKCRIWRREFGAEIRQSFFMHSDETGFEIHKARMQPLHLPKT
jgi:NAD dependent epimerase/dehydratase family enzyme